ncbi:MAG: hypothetical protein Q4F13_06850 [Pseudomonadota bacterium]|nr:hypothetical protein [Pseudomonadota bacterium]
MPRLKDLRIVDPVLTNLAAGYINEEFIGDKVLPRVTVQKEGGKVPLFGKAQFVEHRTERAIRAASNVRDPEGVKSIDFVLQEHDIATRLDYREKQEADFALDAVETANTMEILRLGHELQVARLAQNPASYAAGNTLTLSGADQFTDPASDPLGVVLDAKAAVRQLIVREPNTMTMGYETYRALRRHPQLVGLLSTNKDRVLTLDDLKRFFEVDTINIGKAVYSEDGSAVRDIWGDNLILSYTAREADGQRSYRVPSFGYTLVKQGWPQVDRYTDVGGKVEFIRATEIYKPFVLAAGAGYLVADTNA